MNTLLKTALAVCMAVSLQAADINLKFTGISIDPQGTEGTDYVAERLWYDTLNDDDVVLYIKSTVNIAMSHNADNLIGKGYDPVDPDDGDIWYKVDGDLLRISNPYQTRYSHDMYNDKVYNIIQFKYDETGPFNLAAFKGKADMDNGEPVAASDHFRYGYTDVYGDEWHTITFWDNDSATADYVNDLYASNGDLRDACSSDGKIIYIVLDPQTPAITVSATGSDEYYTTPAKFYYTGKIYQQTTYLTGGCTINLYNLQNTETVQYRVNGGSWQDYSAALTASALFSTDDTVYDFEYRNGTSGTARLRKVHYNPAQPAQNEQHPKLRFASETDLEAMKARVTGGDAELTSWFNGYDDEYYIHSEVDYRTGMRNLDGTFGYSSYYYMQRSIGDIAYANAFVGRMKDYDETYLRRTKEALLYLYTADPIGGETFAGRGGGPSQERVMYSDGKCTFSPQMAYDLIFHYTTDNGYTHGMTPMQHIKIRDNLASEAANLIRFPNSTGGGFWMTSDYGNASTRNVQIEQAWTCIALALPTYNTEYYGTSGADKVTAATYTYAPLEEMPIAWIDVSDKVLINHPTDQSLYRKSALACIISEHGLYIGQPREGYIGMMMRRANDFLIVRANFDGHHYERLERYFEYAIMTRYPFNGHLMPNSLVEGGYASRWELGWLVRDDFPGAQLYEWSKYYPDTVDWDDSIWSDHTIQPKGPAQNSMITPDWAVLSSMQGDPDAVMMRMCTNPDSTQDGSGTFLNYRPYYNICAYGERLGIEKAGYHRYDNGGDYHYMTSQRRKNTIMIDHENDRAYSRFNAVIGHELTGDDFEYFRMDSYNDYASSDCAFQKNDVILQRHVLFPDKKFFVIGDWLTSGTGSHTYTWLFHGSMYNQTTAGSFVTDQMADRAAWTKPSGVKMTLQFISDVNLRDSIEYDYIDNNTSAGNPEPFVLADRTGVNVPYMAVLYPQDSGQSDPVISVLNVSGAEAATITDGDDNSAVTLMMQSNPASRQSITAGALTSDGTMALCRKASGGDLTYASVMNGTALSVDGTALLAASTVLNALVEPDDSTTAVRVNMPGDSTFMVDLILGGLTAGAAYKVFIDWTTADTVTADVNGACTVQVAYGECHILLARDLTLGVDDRVKISRADGVLPGVLRSGQVVRIPRGTAVSIQSLAGTVLRTLDTESMWRVDLEPGMYLTNTAGGMYTRLVILP